MLSHPPTTCGHTRLHFNTKTDVLKVATKSWNRLDGGLHVAPTFRGEGASALAAWEGYSAPDVWLVFRGGQDPTSGRGLPYDWEPFPHQDSSAPLSSRLSPVWHRTPHRCRPRCPPAALCVVTRSAAQVPPEIAVERPRFIVKIVATDFSQKNFC